MSGDHTGHVEVDQLPGMFAPVPEKSWCAADEQPWPCDAVSGPNHNQADERCVGLWRLMTTGRHAVPGIIIGRPTRLGGREGGYADRAAAEAVRDGLPNADMFTVIFDASDDMHEQSAALWEEFDRGEVSS